jgi:hypothetical protein
MKPINIAVFLFAVKVHFSPNPVQKYWKADNFPRGNQLKADS